jgi:hypothetical protein
MHRQPQLYDQNVANEKRWARVGTGVLARPRSHLKIRTAHVPTSPMDLLLVNIARNNWGCLVVRIQKFVGGYPPYPQNELS